MKNSVDSVVYPHQGSAHIDGVHPAVCGRCGDPGHHRAGGRAGRAGQRDSAPRTARVQAAAHGGSCEARSHPETRQTRLTEPRYTQDHRHDLC